MICWSSEPLRFIYFSGIFANKINLHSGGFTMADNGTSLFPVTVVGSWPRPTYLLDALHQRQAGQLSFKEFNEVADKAVLEALRYQEEAGVDIVSDGEQRRDN